MANNSQKQRVNSTTIPKKKAVSKRVSRSKAIVTKKINTVHKRKLALLLPGHNEELIIQTTIRSAIAAGQDIKDIFVVNDASTDRTSQQATKLLGKDHVLNVHRSGKAIAVLKAIKKFDIETNYTWLHVADADSVFGKDYFRIYKKRLVGTNNVVAVGFVQSLRGNWISHYRAFTYTYSQHLIRRAQSYFHMISVFPGPITSFRTSILSQLEFNVDTITEDFDITIQVHRKKLGGILFIPEAVNYTQDPQSLKDFCKQTARWQRGFFQGVVKYKIGMRPQALDLSIGIQLLENLFFLFQMLVLVPYIIATTGQWIVLPVILILDFFVVSLLAFFSAMATKRLNILASLPYFYFLRWLEVAIFVKAFFEIVIFHKFGGTAKGWQTEGRRYALSALALKDAA